MLSKLSPGELNAGIRRIFSGSDTDLQLFEVEMQPNGSFQTHAHAHDEIIYVQAGELKVGARLCGVGAGLYIRANTLYGLTAGPAGCRFLNFRPCRDETYIRLKNSRPTVKIEHYTP
jgi:redox-sensitive bicupin YhaK (pirin superfamily)